MPITVHTKICRLSQTEFSELSYDVMRYVFEIHNELGRFFDEKIYQRELVHRYPGVQQEVPIDVRYESFCKRYNLDILVQTGGVFEFKAHECLTARDEAQLLHYLMLLDLGHGKLVNFRTETVEHKFVNTTWQHSDRVRFEIQDQLWDKNIAAATQIQEMLITMLRDWGTGLELALYQEALTHFFGGEKNVCFDVEVRVNNRCAGHQRMRLVSPGIALKITALEDNLEHFEDHALRLLAHTNLTAILWVNIGLKMVRFASLKNT